VISFRSLNHHGYGAGLTLVELLVALALAALLLTGMVQITSAASASAQLQRNQAQVQENVRLANRALSRAIHQAGYNPQPWNPAFSLVALAETSADNVTPRGDRLVVRFWSDRNCFDNRNSEVDSAGNPRFFVRESTFDVTASRSLTHQCRYGPSLSELTTQIRRQGFINEIEAFHVLFGDDSDRSGGIDAWVKAGQWSHASNVTGVRVGLLASSEDPLLGPRDLALDVLDATVNKSAERKLYRAFEFTAAIRGHTR
jgi:type II secretory pathway pseudopilin PulG